MKKSCPNIHSLNSMYIIAKTGFIDHTSFHECRQNQAAYNILLSGHEKNTCSIYSKMCKSSSGLTRHMEGLQNLPLKRLLKCCLNGQICERDDDFFSHLYVYGCAIHKS